MREVAGAGDALDEGGDGRGLDVDQVGHRRHRVEPLRVAAHRRVASPLGVYHGHALKKKNNSANSSLPAFFYQKIATVVSTSLEDTRVVIPA